jgi:hypothetical protein
MGEPPRHFLLKAPLIPVRVLGGEVAGEHVPGGAEEVARDLQALGSGHATEDLRHLIVHYLDVPGIDRHQRASYRGLDDTADRSYVPEVSIFVAAVTPDVADLSSDEPDVSA